MGNPNVDASQGFLDMDEDNFLLQSVTPYLLILKLNEVLL